jgi:hypothetical protein
LDLEVVHSQAKGPQHQSPSALRFKEQVLLFGCCKCVLEQLGFEEPASCNVGHWLQAHYFNLGCNLQQLGQLRFPSSSSFANSDWFGYLSDGFVSSMLACLNHLHWEYSVGCEGRRFNL